MKILRNPDYAARRVIMSAYLYYWADAPVLSDAKFDALCRYCVDVWDELDPLRQMQLGTPDELEASGMHIRMTQYSEFGARAWHEYVTGDAVEYDLLPDDRWRFNRRFQLMTAGL